MNSYKAIDCQTFKQGNYSLVPIRTEDRYKIMKWRNEQIYHLRQSKPLTKEDQNKYFSTVIQGLFDKEKPEQLLFSYLEGDKCIGYGGLVHINWIDKNAEVSFILDTQLEKEEFHKHWGIYLDLLNQIAFDELDLHKIYTYAFDLRPYLYEAIESKGFIREAVLKEHCLVNGKYENVVIHCKINDNLILRELNVEDKNITFEWANDPFTRANSYNTYPISFESHSNWFDSKLKDDKAWYYIGEINCKSFGLVRFDIKNNKIVIGITLDNEFRGKKLSSRLLKEGCRLVSQKTDLPIVAYIKKENIPSIKSFEKAGFIYKSDIKINDVDSYEYIYKK